MFINVICYYVRCKGNEVFRMEEYRIMGYINQINGKGLCYCLARVNFIF